MTTNTGFVITDVGNAAATVATPAGPFIHIKEFKVSDAFNIPVSGTETALPGNILYTGVVSNYYVVAYDTIELILFMDATVGPFTFGTVGIYLETGELFALCVWSALQAKTRAVGNQAGNQWRIRARLKLARASVVCAVDVINTTAILEVDNWESLVTPVNNVGNVNMAIVKELTPFNDSVLVVKSTPDEWTINDFIQVFRGSTDEEGCTIGTDRITHPGLAGYGFILPQAASRYLIKFPDGDIRKVVNATSSTELIFSPAKAVTQVGSFSVWEDAKSNSSRVQWADRTEYNAFVLDFNPLWSTPTGTYPTDNEGLNEDALPVLTAPQRPTLLNWKAVQDAVIAKCKLHSVPYNNIVYTDYSYSYNDPNAVGLKTVQDRFGYLLSAVVALRTNRNTINISYLDSESPETSAATKVALWSGTVRHALTVTYESESHFKGLVNGGHALTMRAAVTTGAADLWQTLKAFYAAIDSVTIGKAATTTTGAGTGSAIGLYQLTEVDQEVYTHSDAVTGGTATYSVLAKKVANVITLSIDFTCTGTGTGEDILLSYMIHTRPTSSLFNTPVIAYPAIETSGDFVAVGPTPTPSPTPAPGALIWNTASLTSGGAGQWTSGLINTEWQYEVNTSWLTTLVYGGGNVWTNGVTVNPGGLYWTNSSYWTGDGVDPGIGFQPAHYTTVSWQTYQAPWTSYPMWLTAVPPTSTTYLTNGSESYWTSQSTEAEWFTSEATTWQTSWNTGPMLGVTSARTVSNGTTLTIAKYSDLQIGDYMMALVAGNSSSAGTWTGDADWIERADLNDGPLLRVASKAVVGSEAASFTFTSSVSATLGGVILTWRGAQFDAIGAFGSASSGGAVTVPAFTPLTGSLVYLAVFDQGANITVPNIAGWTEVHASFSLTGPSWRVFQRDTLANGSAIPSMVVDTSATAGKSAAVFFSMRGV